MKRKSRILFSILLLCIALTQAPSLYASDGVMTDSTTKILSFPKGVSIYQLDNGMKVLMIENPALPMVGVNVIIKVGSAYETFSTSGMSHMLEHLLFNGTTTREQKKLYDDVDRIGGYNNAHTDNFYTDFMMVTPTENIKKGMEIQADMLFNSTLPDEKFQKEKGIVLEEISKSIADPQEQLERNTLSILYSGHALSLPTLGTYSTIQSMSRDEVNSFYKNNYVPNNMILSVIGNFQTKEMLSLIKEIYGKAKPGQVIREVNPEWATGFQTPMLQTNSGGMVQNRFYDGDDKVVQIFYQLPLMESSEYFQLIGLVFEKNKDAIQSSLKTEFPQIIKSVKLSARLSPLNNYAEVVIVLSKDVDFNALVNSVTKKIDGLSFNLPDETVKSEATQTRTDFVKNIEKPHMFGIYNSDGIVKKGFEAVLASFSGDEFYKAAKEMGGLKLTSPSIIIIQSPTIKKDKEKVEASNSTKLFKDEITGKDLVVVQNEASNLLAIHYLVKHKAAYELKYGKDASKILHDCLGERLRSEANQKLSSQFGFTFTVNDNPFIPMDDIYLHPDFGYVRAEGLADNLPAAVIYINNQIKNFVPTEDEFKKSVEKFKGMTMMSMGGDKSKKLFDTEYKTLIYEPSQYSQIQTALTYDNMLAFTKEYFNPTNMIISVVSPGSPESINVLFDEFIGTSIKDEPSIYTPTFLMQTKPTTIEKTGGGERSYIFWGFINQIDPKDAPALQALSLILSNEIVFDIREKQGLAYNMSAGIDVNKDKALFYISQGTRPQNIDKLSSQYPKFFKLTVLDKLTQDELEKSVNMYLGRMMFRRLSSINQAFYLGSSLYFENNFTYDKQFLDALKNVKLADVKNVAEKYMKVNNPMLLIVR
ncbi:MAG: insulinase family protein [Ignavibacteriales bacterium]|nr:insulinase family protein [Ignavibacteriales bacterium]